jgi:hypothetical protein
VYLLGGYNDSSIVSTVYTAPINTDGTLGTWTTGTSLPGALHYSHAVVTKNRVYLLGGSNGSAPVSTVYTAPINTDGTLGTWTTGTSLPVVLYLSQAVVTKNRVYLLGGYEGSKAVSTVYTAPFAGGLNDYTDVVDNGGDGTLLLTNATGSGTIPASANTIILTGKGEDALQEGTVELTAASGSGTIPATSVNVVLSGKGEDGGITLNPGQGLAAYPSGLPAYVASNPGQPFIASNMCLVFNPFTDFNSNYGIRNYPQTIYAYWNPEISAYEVPKRVDFQYTRYRDASDQRDRECNQPRRKGCRVFYKGKIRSAVFGKLQRVYPFWLNIPGNKVLSKASVPRAAPGAPR